MANPPPQKYRPDDTRSLAEIFNSTKAHSFTARDDYLTVNDDDEAVYDNAFKAYRKKKPSTKSDQESTTSQSPSDDSSDQEPVIIRPERYDIDRSLIEKLAGPGVFSSVIKHRMQFPDPAGESNYVRRDLGRSHHATADTSSVRGEVGKSLSELKQEIHDLRIALERQLAALKEEMVLVRLLVQRTEK